MGLLDDLLSSLAGQAMGGGIPPQQRQPPQANAGGPDMQRILMVLLPIVMAMLSNRRTQAGGAPSPGGFGASGGGGGLADILGQVLGGPSAGRGGMGGLGGLLEQLQRAGYGEQASSWVARGANKPVPPDAMGQVFGRDALEQIARHAGISVDDTSRGLSQLLPEVVDTVTPQGEAPDLDSLANSVEKLSRRFGLS